MKIKFKITDNNLMYLLNGIESESVVICSQMSPDNEVDVDKLAALKNLAQQFLEVPLIQAISIEDL